MAGDLRKKRASSSGSKNGPGQVMGAVVGTSYLVIHKGMELKRKFSQPKVPTNFIARDPLSRTNSGSSSIY